jgi:L-ascorbate metabolism protein UlaG (beta-lactamase superfamily)
MFRCLLAVISVVAATGVAHAAETGGRMVSMCQAIAARLPASQYARLDKGEEPPIVMAAAPARTESVRITYIDHSTYFIETPGGVTIATDYSGAYRMPATPTVVTMNKAHSGHYTLAPDPAIRHALQGWQEGGKAEHRLTVGDTYIRNVVSDLRSFGGGIEQGANSIFIFETAGLCVGHVGHLHFELNDDQIADIGRLDIVMIPVDGGLTMTAPSMRKTVQRLRSSLVMLMHRRRAGALEEFLAGFGKDFALDFSSTPTISVSLKTLPKKPTIFIPPNL